MFKNPMVHDFPLISRDLGLFFNGPKSKIKNRKRNRFKTMLNMLFLPWDIQRFTMLRYGPNQWLKFCMIVISTSRRGSTARITIQGPQKFKYMVLRFFHETSRDPWWINIQIWACSCFLSSQDYWTIQVVVWGYEIQRKRKRMVIPPSPTKIRLCAIDGYVLLNSTSIPRFLR